MFCSDLLPSSSGQFTLMFTLNKLQVHWSMQCWYTFSEAPGSSVHEVSDTDLLIRLTAYIEPYVHTLSEYYTSTLDFEKVPCTLDKFFPIHNLVGCRYTVVKLIMQRASVG